MKSTLLSTFVLAGHADSRAGQTFTTSPAKPDENAHCLKEKLKELKYRVNCFVFGSTFDAVYELHSNYATIIENNSNDMTKLCDTFEDLFDETARDAGLYHPRNVVNNMLKNMIEQNTVT